jgi:hypothetical protein
LPLSPPSPVTTIMTGIAIVSSYTMENGESACITG